MRRGAFAVLVSALSLVVPVALFGHITSAAAVSGPLVVGNYAAFGSPPIATYDFSTGATVNSFVPSGATTSDNGRGLEVVGNEVLYTELVGGIVGPTDVIHVAPFNGGAGGADIRTLPSPRPSVGIQDLAFKNGVLYALTGYPFSAPQVFGLNPTTGAVLSGPVALGAPANPDSDGFTVLPNGNFLVNTHDASCTYAEFNPLTGVATGPSFTVAGHSVCTGVDTDGVSLYIATDITSNPSTLTQTDLSGALLANTSVANVNYPDGGVEDISLVQSASANRPPDCSSPTASPNLLWPANHKLATITVGGVTDPDGNTVTITITGVTQDEPINGLGDGDTGPDAAWVAGHSNQVMLRAERAGTRDGRVYVIAFSASDGNGGTCTGSVRVSVPHDMAHPAIDSGQTVNSFGP